MTVTEPSAHPWLRLYEDRAKPLRIPSADVEGAIPAGLRGTHYRVGPAAGRSYGTPLSNAFADSDGYVGAYTFTDAGVGFRGDLVRTPVLRREQAAGRLIGATFSTLADRRLPARMLTGLRGMITSFAPAVVPPQAGWDAVKDSPNHVPCVIGDRLLLIGGAGAPFALDPRTLAPLGREDFGGTLPKRQLYLVGESHLDPGSGERCFLEICTFPTGVRLWSVGPHGTGRGSRLIKLPHVYLPHDFGLTPTKIVVPLGPIHADYPALVRATLGFAPMNDVFRWRPDEPTRYLVIDRRTWTTREYEAPTSYPVHVANAFDDGDDIVMDINIHSDDSCIRGFTASLDHNWGHPGFTNRLHRVRLTADGQYSSRELLPFDCETPFSSDAYEGRPTRYVYAFATARGIAGSSRIVKVDTTSGSWDIHDYGEGHVVCEPVFTPDPDAAREDSGWLLCQVYDANLDRSFLSVLDAADFGKEHARVTLSGPLPYLLHGKFVGEPRT